MMAEFILGWTIPLKKLYKSNKKNHLILKYIKNKALKTN